MKFVISNNPEKYENRKLFSLGAFIISAISKKEAVGLLCSLAAQREENWAAAFRANPDIKNTWTENCFECPSEKPFRFENDGNVYYSAKYLAEIYCGVIAVNSGSSYQWVM